MIKSLRGKKKGFSLVELIVVIAIMGILAAVAVPKFSAYQANAEKRAMKNTAKLIADATLVASEAGEIKLGSDELSESEIETVKGYLNKDIEINGHEWYIMKMPAREKLTSEGKEIAARNARIHVELRDSDNSAIVTHELDI